MLIAFYFLEIYCFILFIFLLVLLTKRKKLPILPIFLNVMCVSFFFWFRYKVEKHDIIFTGNYQKAEDWGQGLANLMVFLMNLGVVYLIFTITQIVFIIFFRKEFRKLNGSKEKTLML